MADVALRDVVKRFDEVEAVRQISLQIPDKEFVVLVGPSGCGKSTTLRMIAGLEEVTAGDIVIGGDVVNDVPSAKRDIAMVFQNYALYPHMTVFENMAFGLQQGKMPRREVEHRVRERPPPARQHTSSRARSRICPASRARSRAGSVSGWRWAARSFGNRPSS